LSIRQEEFIFDEKSWQAKLDVNVIQDWAPASWQQLKDAVNIGNIEIGLHGVSHTPWAWMTEEQLENEALDSINRVRQEIGVIPTSFSFPHGSTNRLAFKVARNYYNFCFTSEALKVKSKIDLNKGIPRFNVFSDQPVNINFEINYPKIARYRRALINLIKTNL
jgi:peptidoglycan/xylan/chitin deacetylase (PgdA/CDA1 family)